jgi:hypothetical protein
MDGGGGGHELVLLAVPRGEIDGLEEVRVEIAGLEARILEHGQCRRRARAHAADVELRQRAAHARDRVIARLGPHDEFREQRVVVHANLHAAIETEIEAHTGPAGHAQVADAADRGQELVVRILGVDAHLDRPAAPRDRALVVAQRLA